MCQKSDECSLRQQKVSNLSDQAPPSFDIDPFDNAYLRDPYAWHGFLRQAAPVIHLSKYDCYAVGRYDEVKEAMSNHEDFSSADGTGLGSLSKGTAQRSRSPIIEVDPPEHNAVRRPMNNILSPRLVKEWTDAFAASAASVVDAALAKDSFDIIGEIVEPFVLEAFPDFLGIGKEGRENFLLIGDFVLNSLGPDNELYRKTAKAAEPVLGWMMSKYDRGAMAPGRLGALIWKGVDEGKIDPSIAETLIRTFLRGGTDTVISGLGTLLAQLVLRPDQWEILKNDRSKMSTAIDEAIRLESPAQSMFRNTRRQVKLGGYVLEADKKILCSLGAANRDPDRWRNPDQFDFNRSVQGHLGFGVGVHFCIGQRLARAETEAMLGALLDRVDSFEAVGEPEWRMNNVARRLDNFRVSATRLAECASS
ncbi:cytochrome P450 [Sphingobium chlorophenolicum]|nr:cytochrome P450 [Sphingobium chlorophenolicum]